MAKKYIKRRTFTDLTSKDLYFRNFRAENKKNPQRKPKYPEFGIKLDKALAEQMENEGWYIRWTKVAEDAPEGVESIPWLKVFVKYKFEAPMINLIYGKNDITPITEESLASLDGVAIDSMDVEIRPYNWDDSGQYGAAAELCGMNIYCKRSLLEDRLRKYMSDDEGGDEE